MKMPFGKFQGREVSDVPSDYLTWCQEEGWVGNKYGDDLEDEINTEMMERENPGSPKTHFHEYEEEAEEF
jgi:uncharacterized protein (DUF3820 family)